jgi:hypothetical protein
MLALEVENMPDCQRVFAGKTIHWDQTLPDWTSRNPQLSSITNADRETHHREKQLLKSSSRVTVQWFSFPLNPNRFAFSKILGRWKRGLACQHLKFLFSS